MIPSHIHRLRTWDSSLIDGYGSLIFNFPGSFLGSPRSQDIVRACVRDIPQISTLEEFLRVLKGLREGPKRGPKEGPLRETLKRDP